MGAPNQMELRARQINDNTQLLIELWMNDKPLGHIIFDPPELEQFIHQLSAHRAALSDPVAVDLDPGSRLEALVDPAWRIPNQRPQQGRVLALRHPGFGWLSFVIPDSEAEQIAEWLVRDIPIEP